MIHYFDDLPLQNVVMVTMDSIVTNLVMGVYLIPVIGNMVYVQIHLDVNIEDTLDSWGSVVKILTQCFICFSYRKK